MSTAFHVLKITEGASAVTYYGGYSMYPHHRFEPAKVEEERRHPETNRVTYGLYRYKDGSAIELRKVGDRIILKGFKP